MSNKVLIAEISGKRPGDTHKRHTETFKFDYDHVIISNNSEGYETDWDIINVPEDYQSWYKDNIATSDIAYYAPMNRSYAIKYAKEHGYKYLVQLDDNIVTLEIKYLVKVDGYQMRYGTLASTPHIDQLPNDMIKYMEKILDLSNVGMVGMSPDASSLPEYAWLKERYVYSAFMLNLEIVPPVFQGDFEDDIEYRLKLKQAGIPTLEVAPFHYAKTAQNPPTQNKEDVTGNRQAYKEVGLNRGKVMSKLYGDTYSRGWSDRGSGVKRDEGQKKFRHKLKSFKVGVRVKDINVLKQGMLSLFKKYATKRSDSLKVSKKLPNVFLHIELPEKDKASYLFDLINLCVTTGSIPVVGKDDQYWEPKYVFQMSGEHHAKSKFEKYIADRPEIKCEESGSK